MLVFQISLRIRRRSVAFVCASGSGRGADSGCVLLPRTAVAAVSPGRVRTRASDHGVTDIGETLRCLRCPGGSVGTVRVDEETGEPITQLAGWRRPARQLG